MNEVNYVYRVRDKQTGEYQRGYNGRSLWTRKHNAEARFTRSIKEGKYEVVKFELKEVIEE